MEYHTEMHNKSKQANKLQFYLLNILIFLYSI